MKIYCLSTYTGISDYCGLSSDRIVSSMRAVEDYISCVKERIAFIIFRKPYLREYPVYVSLIEKEPDIDGVYRAVNKSTIVLEINSDNSFKRSLH